MAVYAVVCDTAARIVPSATSAGRAAGTRTDRSDGQENLIVNIDSQNLGEVREVVSLSGHQENSNLILVEPVWNELNPQQQDAMSQAVEAAVRQVPGCVEEEER
jgi:TRAP-type C4-dicarboxylate transport system substrate-binding protein